ncbi:type VI secretion system protein ImpA [Methylobacterium sp. ap11]|uniref:type VI secretion system protein TssA n=1 Tax=Methylobacterium sp. ap11 TaxID=1761799 RepID=UPI0008D5EF0D|nr:type VI secretion system protein TssA [Methylobacterium sp. ap11]SEP19969.1 type VI secretion system protein ImpA [Methylobacterium sp. ap11]
MPIDLDNMLARVRDDDPVGPDIRSDISVSATYLQLKDARSQARAAERAAEAAGEPIAVPAAWSTVRDLAGGLLARSKDLEVAAWLIEALARLEGFSGLALGFALVDGLVDRYWPDLHSVDEDDAEGRLAPLAGLNGIGGDGVLIQPIRMIPLVPGHAYGTHALWHARGGGRGTGQLGHDFMEARAATASDALRAHAETARTAHAAFLRMSATLDAFCGTDAPPLANIRTVLEEVLDVYRGLLGAAWGQAPGQPEARAAPAAEAPFAVPPPAALPSGPRTIASRDQAFDELLTIAAYFRQTEPHSPISYALETVVRRGRMTLMDLLGELIPEPEGRERFLRQAGIEAGGEGRGP